MYCLSSGGPEEPTSANVTSSISCVVHLLNILVQFLTKLDHQAECNWCGSSPILQLTPQNAMTMSSIQSQELQHVTSKKHRVISSNREVAWRKQRNIDKIRVGPTIVLNRSKQNVLLFGCCCHGHLKNTSRWPWGWQMYTNALFVAWICCNFLNGLVPTTIISTPDAVNCKH